MIFFFFFFFRATDTLSRKKKKKIVQKVHHSVARLSPYPYPHVLFSAVQCYTLKTRFSLCSTAKLGIIPGIRLATYIIDQCYASRLTVLQFLVNRVKVVTFICARGHVHSRSAWAENIANAWLLLCKHMGTLQSAITLILRLESKFVQVKLLVLIHSVCPCKHVLKCSQPPP